MSEPTVMEGRWVCCGKLEFAGHAHDCPSRTQPASESLRQLARDLASVAEAAEMLASRQWEPSVVDGWLLTIGDQLRKAQRLVGKCKREAGR